MSNRCFSISRQAKKTGALAASLTAQTLAFGVLVAIPLIFTDRLPIVLAFTPLALPAPPPPLPPRRVQSSASSSSPSRASSAPARIYRLPTHISNVAQADVAVIEAPPAATLGVEGGLPGTPPMASRFFRELIPQPVPRVAESASLSANPTRVGGDVQAARLMRKVMPIYPALARQARVSGTVELLGIIAKDGTIQKLQVVSGPPLLTKAAIDAVRQWLYRPTLLDGHEVEVIAPISVIFSLSQ